MPGAVCDGKRDLCVHENALGCYTACMKDRNFAVIDTYRFPPFWLVNIIDSDGRCRPYGYRSTMSMCVLGGNFNMFRTLWKVECSFWWIYGRRWLFPTEPAKFSCVHEWERCHFEDRLCVQWSTQRQDLCFPSLKDDVINTCFERIGTGHSTVNANHGY